MSLRLGFDMDGVLADFESAFHEVEVRLFGADARPNDPGQEEEAETNSAEVRPKPDPTRAPPSSRHPRRRRDAIWAAIRATPDFWTTLKPAEEGAVRRIHGMMLRYKWEVFFITQRPPTEGDTVQRQTQHWLVEQGFDLPSVLVLGGSRGAAAAALRLDYHVDDSPQHCIDIVSESETRPVLILHEQDQVTVTKAKRLGIATARSIGECLDGLEEVSRTQPGFLGRLAAMVGWK